MKIVIYAICKNEAQFAKRWADSIRGLADKVIVCDTGSTDGTQDILRSYGFEVHDIVVDPWRFDTARNLSLTYIPEGYDVAVCPDLDDVFLPDWREVIERYWISGKTKLLRYIYINNWIKEGEIPAVSIIGFKIHDPYFFEWLDPIHEYLESKDLSLLTEEEIVMTEDHIFEHYPVDKEERKSRLRIFEDSFHTEQYRDNARMIFLYGRELLTFRMWEKSIPVFLRYLDVSKAYMVVNNASTKKDVIQQQRSMACRYIAEALSNLDEDPNDILVWLFRSIAEYPGGRDPWLYLANAWLTLGEPLHAYSNAKIGAKIPYKSNAMEIEELAWSGERIQQLLTRSRELLLEQETKVYTYENEIEGWMTRAELEALFKEAKNHSSIVEIGSWKGRSTHALLSGCPGIVYAVDHWKGTESDGRAHQEAFIDPDSVYTQFCGNVGEFANLRPMRMSSEEASKQFEDKSIDMVFIDADHSYEAVKRDIELWLPKAKKLICGHDFQFEGVEKAVKEKFEKINIVGTIWVSKLS